MEYWKDETPIEVDTGANVLRYYEAAGKLQISLPNWADKDGVIRPGKTVALDIAALQANTQAVELLKNLCK